MKRCLLLTIFFVFATTATAALPDALIQACLAPAITEHISGQTWQLMSAESWDNGAMRITETNEATLTAQTTAPHPHAWAETEVILSQPHDTPERVATEQTLTIRLKAMGIVPKLNATILFLNQAKLPPCSVTTWQGKLALVANDKEWYILADDPAITITQTDEVTPRTTIRLSNISLEKRAAMTASIRVGEGALP